MSRRAATAIVFLAVGLAAAAAVYATAPAAVEDDDVYEMFHSRKYTRELERVGGRAGLLASDLNEWLGSLWVGKRRALTVACATVLVAGGYLVLTRPRGGAT